jgi:hypothetical protein
MLNPKIDDALFDAVLAEAFKETFERDIYAIEKKYEDRNFSNAKRNKYEKRERRALRENERGQSDFYYYATRTVASLLIVFSLSFGLMMAFPSVRAETVNTVVKFFEKYLTFNFSNDSVSIIQVGKYSLGYMPNGYTLIESFETDSISSYTFQNDSGNMFDFNYGPSASYTPQFDTEKSTSETISINGTDVYLITNKSDGKNAAIWSKDNEAFCIKGSLSDKDIRKIIENIS